MQEKINKLETIVGALADKLGIEISIPTKDGRFEKIKRQKVIKANPEQLLKSGIREASADEKKELIKKGLIKL